jgi:TetR/AcrR family transcriptional regulator, copper-responsive repressor
MRQNMAMGRPKNFSREEVLEKAIALFWHQGFADTSLQDLEKATGVNKSGLYSEFKDKDDIFLASLRHYLGNRDTSVLLADPPGLQNIAAFFQEVLLGTEGQRGCLAVNSMREVSVLPSEARDLISRSQTILKRGFARNIAAAKREPKNAKAAKVAKVAKVARVANMGVDVDAASLADLTMTFFIGMSLEQNMPSKKSATATRKKIDDLIALLNRA